MKNAEKIHTPSRRADFLLFRYRPAQASPLRSEASRALRSRAKNREIPPKSWLPPPVATTITPESTL